MRILGITLMLIGVAGVAWVMVPIVAICIRYGRPVRFQMDSMTSLLLSFSGTAPPMIGVDIGASYAGVGLMCAGVLSYYWSNHRCRT